MATMAVAGQDPNITISRWFATKDVRRKKGLILTGAPGVTMDGLMKMLRTQKPVARPRGGWTKL